MKRTEQGNELSAFGNAVREVLGLEPIYSVEGVKRNSRPSDLERFYVQDYSLPTAAKRVTT